MSQTTMTSLSKIPEKVYNVLEEGVSWNEKELELLEEAINNLKEILLTRLRKGERDSSNPFRLSNIGTPCTRRFWYQIHKPNAKEKLRPQVLLKFLYGDLIEELVLLLIGLAGYEVKGQQDELSFLGVKGHRDAIVNGTLADVKSASTFSMKKFIEGISQSNDPFGYLQQLQTYVFASEDDDKVTNKNSGAFIAVDKQHGHIVVDEHSFDPKEKEHLKERINYLKSLEKMEEPPERPYSDVPEGKSGNRRLGTVCSYCLFKGECWPNLRTFIYSSGPKFLTHVAKQPNVPEVTT